MKEIEFSRMAYGVIYHIQMRKKSVIRNQEYSIVRNIYLLYSEAVSQRFYMKKVFLKISQNSQGNTCTRGASSTVLKKRLAQLFSSEFCKIFKRTPFFIEHLRSLLFIFEEFNYIL